MTYGISKGSVSDLDPDLDPDWIRSVDPDLGSGSGSKRAKMTEKNRKSSDNFMFRSAGCLF
jgi:hypothetical protein